MSSRREVLIRILALLQRKTLIKPKNRTLKCLKLNHLTVRSIKNFVVLTEDGTFALFFRPHPGGFDSSRVPTPGNLPSKAKKMLMPGGQPGGVLGAGGIDWCISRGQMCERCFFTCEKNCTSPRRCGVSRQVSRLLYERAAVLRPRFGSQSARKFNLFS